MHMLHAQRQLGALPIICLEKSLQNVLKDTEFKPITMKGTVFSAVEGTDTKESSWRI